MAVLGLRSGLVDNRVARVLDGAADGHATLQKTALAEARIHARVHAVVHLRLLAEAGHLRRLYSLPPEERRLDVIEPAQPLAAARQPGILRNRHAVLIV